MDLPPYIVAGPGLPLEVPGGSTVLTAQAQVDAVCYEFLAVDAMGTLHRWTDTSDYASDFRWETAGITAPATPAFPVTAWR